MVGLSDVESYVRSVTSEVGRTFGGGVSYKNPDIDIDGHWSNWMQTCMHGMSQLRLEQVCLPATHDSGMSVLRNGTHFGTSSVTKTQVLSVANQLQVGVRVFDIRPVCHNGSFVCGHYTKIFSSQDNELTKALSSFGQVEEWQGGDGESIDEIIEAVNKFTEAHNELIVLNMADNWWYDVNRQFSAFDKKQTKDFFAQVNSIKKLWKMPAEWINSNRRLTDLTMNDYIGKDSEQKQIGAAVLVIVPDKFLEDKDISDAYMFKGFYKPSLWHNKDAYLSLSEQMQDVDYIANVFRDLAASGTGDLVSKLQEYIPGEIGDLLHGAGSYVATTNRQVDGVVMRALAKNNTMIPLLFVKYLTNLDENVFKTGKASREFKFRVAQADAINDIEFARQCLMATAWVHNDWELKQGKNPPGDPWAQAEEK